MDKLIENIKKEKILTDSHDRYPVRFLFLPLSNLIEDYLFTLVNTLDLKIIKISDYLPTDKWKTWESLYTKLEKEILETSKDLIFVGFSEYLRLCPSEQFEVIFTNLIGLENSFENKSKKRRCYFMMHSFETLFKTYVKENHHRNIFYDPILEGDSDGSCVKVCNFIFTNKNDNVEINSVKDFLNISVESKKYNFDQNIYVNSPTLLALANKHKEHLNENLFKISIIDSADSILLMKIIDAEKVIPVLKKYNLIEWFSNFISLESKKDKFDIFANNILKLNNDDDYEIIKSFKNANNLNSKEFIKAYCEIYKNTKKIYGFLAYMFDQENYSIGNFNEFVKQVYLSIGDIAIQQAFIDERLKTIKYCFTLDNTIDSPKELLSVYDILLNKYIRKNIYVPDFKDVTIKDCFYHDLCKTVDNDKLDSTLKSFSKEFVVGSLTSLSSNEKRIIIMMLMNGILDKNDAETLYPQLFGYLYYQSEAFIDNTTFISQYFKEYRKSKLQARPTKYLKEYFDSIIPSKFLDFYNDNNIENINNNYNASKVFVLDGVGAEYLNALSYFLEIKHGIKLTHCSYCKSFLPTTTDINKQIIESIIPNIIWKSSFDMDVIHGDFYNLDKNLEKALTILEKIVDDIIAESNGGSFLIIADHGCTASHKIFQVTKKYSFANSEHEGRCCEIQNNTKIDESNDYVIYKDTNSKDWVLSLKATSLWNTPSHEAHGGATIEEVIIPYIYFGNGKTEDEPIITMIKNTISGIDRTIVFSLTPSTTNYEVTIIEQTGVKTIPEFSNGIYTAKLNSGKAQEITIIINNKYKNKITVKNNSGMNNGGFIL